MAMTIPMFTFAVLLGLAPFINPTSATPPLPADYFKGEFDLQSFRFQLEDGSDREIQCSNSEVQNGLEELPFFGTMKAPGRRLIPSKHPLRREAAWLIHPVGCRSLKPGFNAVGFSSINAETGQAEIYLGYFSKIEIPEEEWISLHNTDKMRLFFQPDFTLVEVAVFSGQCSYRPQKLFGTFDLEWWSASKDLECVMEDGKGIIQLKKR